MRVLLDEHLPHRLRQLFAARIEAVTVGYQGLKVGSLDILQARSVTGMLAEISANLVNLRALID